MIEWRKMSTLSSERSLSDILAGLGVVQMFIIIRSCEIINHLIMRNLSWFKSKVNVVTMAKYVIIQYNSNGIWKKSAKFIVKLLRNMMVNISACYIFFIENYEIFWQFSSLNFSLNWHWNLLIFSIHIELILNNHVFENYWQIDSQCWWIA